jgi:hypothetical protein
MQDPAAHRDWTEVRVESRIIGMPRLAAAGVMVIIASAAAAGCASSNSPAASTAKPETPLQAIQLAANTSRDVTSFTANMSVQINESGASATSFNLAGTLSEQLHPNLLAEADFTTFSAAGQSLPGGLAEVISTSAIYMKLSVLTRALHTSKPWVEISFSALTKATGVNLSSLLNEVQTSSPLNQSQLFAGAGSVRKVGTGVVDGVPVTEYSGTVSMSAAIAQLPASLRSSLGPDIQKAGIKSARFTEWIDAQHHVRKTIVDESGTSLSETITTTVTSINQPVTIAIPTSGQTTVLPASVLNASGL